MVEINELMQKEYRIIGLQVENFMRLKAVEFYPDPDEPVVVVSGENNQGKTSLINSIFAALNYADAAKVIPQIIHGNEEKSETTLDLGDLVVTRKVTKKGSSLVVKGKNGRKFSTPQAIMDALAGKMFDLQEFISRMKPEEQRRCLLELLDLPFDIDELEAERKKVYDKRAEINRDLKKQEGYLATLPKPKAGVPEQEINVQAILDEIARANNLRLAKKQKEQELANTKEKGLAKNEEIKRLEETLAKARKEKEDLLLKYNTLKTEIAKMPDPDTTVLHEQLKNAEQINQDVRNNREYTKAKAKCDELKAEADALSKDLMEIDKRKTDALAAAKLPVEGLSFDEKGILFDNAPFAQASTSAKIRVAFALAVAKNPKIRVALIRDFQAFDKKNRELIKELARQHRFQIWAEMVDPQAEPGIIIQNGLVKEVVKKTVKEKSQVAEPVQQEIGAIDQITGEFD